MEKTEFYGLLVKAVNDKTKSYHLKKGIVTGFDVPKKINWKDY